MTLLTGAPRKVGGALSRLASGIREDLDAAIARDPATAPVVINRGTSGHRVPDLAARWDRDVIELAHDVVSIKIGINDVWRQFDGRGEATLIEVFVDGSELNYRPAGIEEPGDALLIH